jgi:hypothetical protein
LTESTGVAKRCYSRASSHSASPMARLVNALLLLAVVVPAGVGTQDNLAAIRADAARRAERRG